MIMEDAPLDSEEAEDGIHTTLHDVDFGEEEEGLCRVEDVSEVEVLDVVG